MIDLIYPSLQRFDLLLFVCVALDIIHTCSSMFHNKPSTFFDLYFVVIRTLTGHKANIRCLDFHPYGDFVASGSLDTNVKVTLAQT